MTHFQLKIKELRRQRNLTQQELSDVLNVKRSLLGSYEEGRAHPKIDLLKTIATFFSVSLDELVGKQQASNEPKVLAITLDNKGNENIELVPIKAQAGYLNGFGDLDFIKDLPKFQLPFLRNGTFRAFEIAGDSMLPLSAGTILVAEYQENITLLENLKTYVWITQTEGIVYKRYGGIIQNKAQLISDNKLYKPISISLEDIMEVWKVKLYISNQIP